jgi:CRISPR-associated exonuclease Cas4
VRAPPEGSGGGLLPLRVTDLRQFLYCPRVVYYHHVAPVERKVSFKMAEGRDAHLTLDGLERRRTLARYRLDEGERSFHVALSSERLGLSGVLDMAIEGPAGLFPVEFKWTEGAPMLGHKYQLAGYALLLEEARQRPVTSGFLALVPGRRLIEVGLTESVRLHTRRLLTRVRRLIASRALPEPTVQRGRCVDCEFRNYCRDVDFGTRVAFEAGSPPAAAPRRPAAARQRHDNGSEVGRSVLPQR